MRILAFMFIDSGFHLRAKHLQHSLCVIARRVIFNNFRASIRTQAGQQNRRFHLCTGN